ncbi:MAG: TRAP transporter substrate-binding protein DctP [Spirochaetales bacterium]|nr:TRAP transporter substrate-binding protein DctP [Spirochaetales bacterium]
MRHTKSGSLLIFVLLALVLVGAFPLSALTIKIATLAPAGSPWVESLRRLSGDLERSSDGALSFKIYAGGTAGEEADMIRKMRIGQLQGAALTQLGLALLEPGLLALSTPFLIQGEEELDYVMGRLRPEYTRRLDEGGFRLVSFLKAGWVHFFGRQAVGTPAELRGQRLGLPDGDADFVEIWRSMGFSAFSLPMGDLLVGLQSGMVDAYYSPPAVAASFQWFTLTPHMSEMRIGPVVGGIVLSAEVFDEIPEELRPLVRARFLELDGELNRDMAALEREALAAMRRRGLIVDSVPPDAVREWERLGQRGAEVVVGRVFSRMDYDQVASAVQEHRSQQ